MCDADDGFGRKEMKKRWREYQHGKKKHETGVCTLGWECASAGLRLECAKAVESCLRQW